MGLGAEVAAKADGVQRRVALGFDQTIVQILDVFFQIVRAFRQVFRLLGGGDGLAFHLIDLFEQGAHLHLQPFHLLHQLVDGQFRGVRPGGGCRQRYGGRRRCAYQYFA